MAYGQTGAGKTHTVGTARDGHVDAPEGKRGDTGEWRGRGKEGEGDTDWEIGDDGFGIWGFPFWIQQRRQQNP